MPPAGRPLYAAAQSSTVAAHTGRPGRRVLGPCLWLVGTRPLPAKPANKQRLSNAPEEDWEVAIQTLITTTCIMFEARSTAVLRADWK